MLENNRILIVDDNESIHDDFRKILLNPSFNSTLSEDYDDLEKELFGKDEENKTQEVNIVYNIDFAFQGQEAFEKVKKSLLEDNLPYALIFVDVRMPPGWDGIETIKKIWDIYPEAEIVVCSAYSDYPWEKIISVLGVNDRLLFLKKPFDSIEVKQMALSLVTKWNLYQKSKNYVNDLEKEVIKRTRQLKGMVSELINNRDKIKHEFYIREKAEQELEKEKNMLVSIFESINRPLIYLDQNFNVKLFNKSVLELLKIDPIMLKDKRLTSNYVVEDEFFTDMKLSSESVRYFENKEKQIFYLTPRFGKNTNKIKLEFYFSVMKSKNDEFTGVLISLNDLKEKVDVSAKKKVSFGENILKDFKNIFGSITGNINMVKDELKENKKASEYINELEKSSIRVTKLLDDFEEDNNKKEKKEPKKIQVKNDIFVLENDDLIKNMLSDFFTELDYNVKFVDYKDLINNSFVDKKISFVIMDSVIFNQINDFEFLKDLKEVNEKYKLILLTSIHNKNLILNYRNYYFDDVITKPFDLSDLERVLSNFSN